MDGARAWAGHGTAASAPYVPSSLCQLLLSHEHVHQCLHLVCVCVCAVCVCVCVSPDGRAALTLSGVRPAPSLLADRGARGGDAAVDVLAGRCTSSRQQPPQLHGSASKLAQSSTPQWVRHVDLCEPAQMDV